MPVTARDVMQTKLVTVRADLPMSELEEVLLRNRVHGAPVVEEGRVVGIISRSDIVRQLKLEEDRIAASAFYLEPFDADQRTKEDDERVIQAAASRLARLHVRDMMIEEVVTIEPDASLQELATRMLDARIHRLLVTEGETLLGLVSSFDLVKLFASGRAQAETRHETP